MTSKPDNAASPRRLRALWMIPPATGWHRKSGGILGSRLTAPLVGLLAVMLLASGFALSPESSSAQLIVLFTLGIVLLGWLAYLVQRDLFAPLSHLRNWALRMRDGRLNARIPVPAHGEFAELARDINRLSGNLQDLSLAMEEQVRKQTERIAQKTQSLQVLYQVAANINAARDLDDLLARFLSILTDVTHARAGTVRLLTDDGHLRLVASSGLTEEVLNHERLIPVGRCFCGSAITKGIMVCDGSVRNCEKHVGRPLFDSAEVEVVAVPLEYRGRRLGLYNLFVDPPGTMGLEDMQDMLTSIGRHLGMAIEKMRLDNEAQRLSIIEERTLLAHELHDSLAQSLASLRFQASALEESIRDNSTPSSAEVHRLRGGIEEAHYELRELMTHFRAPMDERGLIPSVEQAVAKFRKNTGISIYLQNEWRHAQLPAALELQILRILQESLCNIRKHAKARAVRVLLRHTGDSDYEIMVEDDGVGIGSAEPHTDSRPGEHIGLSVMQERARRLGGTLAIETEAGEGTRLLLNFRYPGQSAALSETPPIHKVS